MYGPGSENLSGGPPESGSLNLKNRRDSPRISVNAVGTPDLARSWMISSPEAPPASPAESTSCPKECSSRATVTPRPPAR